jgi:hypothetical protein
MTLTLTWIAICAVSSYTTHRVGKRKGYTLGWLLGLLLGLVGLIIMFRLPARTEADAKASALDGLLIIRNKQRKS